MKKLFIAALVLAVFGFGIWTTPSFAASVVINLRATWTASTDNIAVTGYGFNNSTLDGGLINMFWNTVTQKFDVGSTNFSILPASPQLLNFPHTLQDTTLIGNIGFKMLAVDAAGNKSVLCSESLYNYNITPPDTTPPSVPSNLLIIKP
jgi:hypothetical protein